MISWRKNSFASLSVSLSLVHVVSRFSLTIKYEWLPLLHFISICKSFCHANLHQRHWWTTVSKEGQLRGISFKKAYKLKASQLKDRLHAPSREDSFGNFCRRRRWWRMSSDFRFEPTSSYFTRSASLQSLEDAIQQNLCVSVCLSGVLLFLVLSRRTFTSFT